MRETTLMKFYHIYTKGLEDKVIFREIQDYIVGMNYVAIAQYKTKITILAFVLMSNHFHFAVQASEEDAIAFINLYKRLISVYIRNKYGDSAYLRRMVTSCDQVQTSDDGLRRLIAYILDNPVKAGINCVAFAYPWGSASCYFSAREPQSISLSSLNVRARKSLLHSHVELPESYRISADGYVLPSSYIDFSFVENHYGKPRNLEYFLSVSASSRKVRRDAIMFSDEILTKALKELLENKYGVKSISDLDIELVCNLVRELRLHFNASAKQLARITGLQLRDTLKFLS